MSKAEAFDQRKVDQEVVITECFSFILWLNIKKRKKIFKISIFEKKIHN